RSKRDWSSDVCSSDLGTGGGELRKIYGGMLMQSSDAIDAEGDTTANWTLAAGEAVDEATLADLQFAWRAVRAVKSNAILLADDEIGRASCRAGARYRG